MTDSTSLPRPVLSPLEQRVVAIGTAIVLHAAIIGFAAGLQALIRAAGPRPSLPRDALLIAAVGLLLAQCSLGSLWWARSSWPSYAKTLVVVGATAVLWLLLVGVLETARLAESAAPGWALCLATLTVIVAAGGVAIERTLAPRPLAQSRFTIMFLLLWMALVGVLLGAGRALALRLGWTWAGVRDWQYLWQLQALAVASAALAVGLAAAIRLPRDATLSLLAGAALVLFVTFAFPEFCVARFGTKNQPSYADMFWVMLFQAAFLLAALIPWYTQRPAARA